MAGERPAARPATSPPAGTANISAEVAKARQALADSAASCHPDDVERLERLALSLTGTDLVGAQALRHSVAESVARRKQAGLAAATRARLRVTVADTQAAERPTLLQLVDSTPDSGLPGLEAQISESVRRADRARSRARVAEAAVAALREIGCAVDDGFATHLSAADAAIAPLREHPGYGLRVRLSSTSLETLVVRQPGADGARGATVQQGVCDRMDPAWVLLGQAGVRLAEQHRSPAGVEAVPIVSAGQWTAECHRTADAEQAGVRGVLTDLVRHRGQPVALIFPYAARLATLARGSPDGVALLTAAEALGHTATRVQGADASTVYNTVFWIADRQEDLPAAFAVGSQALRIITIPEPAPTIRRAAAEFFIGLLGPGAQQHAEKLASATHGLRVADIDAVCRMAADLGTPASKVDDAARQYRVGVVENPWGTKALTDRIRTAESELNERVLGQRAAVRKTLDILMRSGTNLTGAQASSSPNRPRGVLFLTRPTGMGKTELAKALAAMVHDDEEARPVRFDMSAFGAEHARQRLIGAPPGYVGYDAGGELVNAVRAQPVNVLLFDEIDKAHPLILDLFLQILEDGRLTDGRGATVHFTECLLMFTSNRRRS